MLIFPVLTLSSSVDKTVRLHAQNVNVMSLSQRVLWCCAEVNPHCSHHLNKDLAGRRSPPPPLWLSQRWEWISSISTFLLFWLFHVLILSSLEVRFQPCQSKYTWFERRFWEISVWACMFMHVSLLSVLEVTAGLWWWEFIFCCFLNLLSLNTLSCGVQLWQHWWAPLNCKPSFQLIGMSFWFKYPAWLITATDNTHNISLHYGSSGRYSD